jgi:hypothetical protein
VSPFIRGEAMIHLKDRYRIVETEMGLMINESRSSVLDVMEMAQRGLDMYEIAMVFNLTPLQVETALAYIADHRERLTPILARALEIKKEREAHYRAVQAEIQKKIDQFR